MFSHRAAGDCQPGISCQNHWFYILFLKWWDEDSIVFSWKFKELITWLTSTVPK